MTRSGAGHDGACANVSLNWCLIKNRGSVMFRIRLTSDMRREPTGQRHRAHLPQRFASVQPFRSPAATVRTPSVPARTSCRGLPKHPHSRSFAQRSNLTRGFARSCRALVVRKRTASKAVTRPASLAANRQEHAEQCHLGSLPRFS